MLGRSREGSGLIGILVVVEHLVKRFMFRTCSSDSNSVQGEQDVWATVSSI